MASSGETRIIITKDGKPLGDVSGNPATFSSRHVAGGWMLPGELVEPTRAERSYARPEYLSFLSSMSITCSGACA